MKKLITFILLLFIVVAQAAQYPLSLGGGGIPKWEPGVNFRQDEIVWEAVSLKFYKAISAHLSGATFPPDLAFPLWEEMADNLNREDNGTVNDDRLVRWDGTDGDNVQDSLVSLTDAGAMSGLTQLNVDNVQVNGNTISVTDIGGDLHLVGNGAGKVIVDGDFQVDGTTTTVNSTTLDVTAAKITVNVGGNQASADSDAALEVEMSDATDAKLNYDSTTASKFTIGEIGSEKEIVTVSDIQTITNKEYANGATVDANLVLDLVTTVKASRPCPQMTQVQRDALTPVNGSCVFNTTTVKLNVYNGTIWTAVGGGVDPWVALTAYKIGNTVHESNKIYLALTDHTSGATFPPDLASNEWVELSDDLNREADLSVTDDALTRWDGTGGDDVQNSLIIVDDSGNMTGVNNLTLTGGVLSDILDLGQVVTPPVPAAGRDKLYFKSDDKLYRLTNGGVESLVGLNFTSSNDNRLIRSDGTGADSLQESGITVSDLDDITGINDISSSTFTLSSNQILSVGNLELGTQDILAPFDKSFCLSHKGVFDFGVDGANICGYGDAFATAALAGEIVFATNAKDINFVTDLDTTNALSKVDGVTGFFVEETPTDGDYKPVGEKFKGIENFFIRGQSDYGLVSDWTGANLTQDVGASNLLTGEFSVWKWTDTGTIANDLVSLTIDIPIAFRLSDIGYEFRYKYDGDDSDIDVLIQCVDDSLFLVSDGDHKLEAYTATTGSALASGEFSPGTCTQIKFILKVAIANAGKELFFDSVKITPFPANIKKLTITQAYSITQQQNSMIGLTGNMRFNLGTATITDEESKIVLATDTGSVTLFTATKKCIVDISISSFMAATNDSLSIYKNGVLYKPGPEVYSLNAYASVVGSLHLDAGETFQIFITGNITNTGADTVLTFSAVSDSDTLVRATNTSELDSMVRVTVGNGQGIVNTAVRRFVNVIDNFGGDITYISSANDGDSFQINKTGFYTVSYTEEASSGGVAGITKGTTSAPDSIVTSSERLTQESMDVTDGDYVSTSWSGILNKDDIIRAAADIGTVNSASTKASFTISKPKVSPHVSIPIDDEFKNEFSARVNAAGVVLSENENFIESDCVESPAGVFACALVANKFSVIPACFAETEGSSADTNATINAISTTSVSVVTQFLGANDGSIPWTLQCARQGSDVKLKTGIVTGRFAASRTCILEGVKDTAAAGSSIAGEQTRILNTATGNCEFVTLTNGTTGLNGTANRFILIKGTYDLECSAPAHSSDEHQVHLYNFSDSIRQKDGEAAYTLNTTNVVTRSSVSDFYTLAGSKTYEIRHFIKTAKASDGLGLAASTLAGNNAVVDTYTKCKITKVR